MNPKGYCVECGKPSPKKEWDLGTYPDDWMRVSVEITLDNRHYSREGMACKDCAHRLSDWAWAVKP